MDARAELQHGEHSMSCLWKVVRVLLVLPAVIPWVQRLCGRWVQQRREMRPFRRGVREFVKEVARLSAEKRIAAAEREEMLGCWRVVMETVTEMPSFSADVSGLVKDVAKLSADQRIGATERREVLDEWRDAVETIAERSGWPFASPAEIGDALLDPDWLEPGSVQPWRVAVVDELRTMRCFYRKHFRLPETYCCSRGMDGFMLLGQLTSEHRLGESLLNRASADFALEGIRKLVVLQRRISMANPTGFLEELRERFGRACDLVLVSESDLEQKTRMTAPTSGEDIGSCCRTSTLVVEPIALGDGLMGRVVGFLGDVVRADLKGVVVLFGIRGVEPFGRSVTAAPSIRTVVPLDMGAVNSNACTVRQPVPGHHGSTAKQLPVF